jgi:WhiB family transcriptional regulator, redox-sensing transcriptional regulator
MTLADTDRWRTAAECRGADAPKFLPPSSGETAAERYSREARAKQICARCAVRQECLAYAVSAREPLGIWGGLNESERSRVSLADIVTA